MIKIIFGFTVAFLFCASLAYSQGKYKDPFASLLPQEVKETETVDRKPGEKRAVVAETEEPLPSLVLQGVLWGGDFPQVIIEGDVYRVGDKLKNLDARIFKIEKNTVFISYGAKIYKIKVGKGREL